MVATTCTQIRYDHRLRELVQTPRDVSCAVQCGVPRSTARDWLNAPSAAVVTLDSFNMEAVQLPYEVQRIRRRMTLLRVLLMVINISRFALCDNYVAQRGVHLRLVIRGTLSMLPDLPGKMHHSPFLSDG